MSRNSRFCLNVHSNNVLLVLFFFNILFSHFSYSLSPYFFAELPAFGGFFLLSFAVQHQQNIVFNFHHTWYTFIFEHAIKHTHDPFSNERTKKNECFHWIGVNKNEITSQRKKKAEFFLGNWFMLVYVRSNKIPSHFVRASERTTKGIIVWTT